MAGLLSGVEVTQLEGLPNHLLGLNTLFDESFIDLHGDQNLGWRPSSSGGENLGELQHS